MQHLTRKHDSTHGVKRPLDLIEHHGNQWAALPEQLSFANMLDACAYLCRVAVCGSLIHVRLPCCVALIFGAECQAAFLSRLG